MRYMKACLGALTVVVLMSSCSSVKEEMKPVSLKNIEASEKFDREWQSNPHRSSFQRRYHYSGTEVSDARYNRLQAVFDAGYLYSADISGRVVKRAADTGNVVWSADVDTDLGGGVGLYEGSVFVGSFDGELISLDSETGQEKWRARASSEILAAPKSNGKVVLATAIDGTVTAFDIDAGTEVWSYNHPLPILSLRTTSEPLVDGDNFIVGFDNGQLLNINGDTGSLVWASRVGQPRGQTELERMVDVDTSPIEVGPYVVVAGYNSRLIAVSKGTGRISWSQDISTSKNIAVSGNTIIVVDNESHVRAFDGSNGTVLWENDGLHRRELSEPAILGDTVVVVDYAGYIHGLSLSDGKFVARAHSRYDRVVTQPVIANGLVFIQDSDSRISAYSIVKKGVSVIASGDQGLGATE